MMKEKSSNKLSRPTTYSRSKPECQQQQPGKVNRRKGINIEQLDQFNPFKSQFIENTYTPKTQRLSYADLKGKQFTSLNQYEQKGQHCKVKESAKPTDTTVELKRNRSHTNLLSSNNQYRNNPLKQQISKRLQTQANSPQAYKIQDLCFAKNKPKVDHCYYTYLTAKKPQSKNLRENSEKKVRDHQIHIKDQKEIIKTLQSDLKMEMKNSSSERKLETQKQINSCYLEMVQSFENHVENQQRKITDQEAIIEELKVLNARKCKQSEGQQQLQKRHQNQYLHLQNLIKELTARNSTQQKELVSSQKAHHKLQKDLKEKIKTLSEQNTLQQSKIQQLQQIIRSAQVERDNSRKQYQMNSTLQETNINVKTIIGMLKTNASKEQRQSLQKSLQQERKKNECLQFSYNTIQGKLYEQQSTINSLQNSLKEKSALLLNPKKSLKKLNQDPKSETVDGESNSNVNK